MATARKGLALAAALLLAGCAAATPSLGPGDPADPAETAELADFRRLAFGPGELRPGRDHLARWEQPLRAALIDASSDHERQVARQHLQDLADLTGLAIGEAPPQTANLLVFFAADPFEAARRHRGHYAHRIPDARSFDGMLAARADSTCFGFLWGGWPSGRGIDFAVVFIRTDRGERTVKGCLVQQTTQVLGLMHDLDPEADSIFSDSGRDVDLTAGDRLMVRLLYDPRLKPGMGWAETEPLARAALREIRSEMGGAAPQ
ncbi:MAG: DUF2927 domain-containing protein [Kiloniellaceae bacterium]